MLFEISFYFKFDLWCLYKGNLDCLLCVSRHFSLTELLFHVGARLTTLFHLGQGDGVHFFCNGMLINIIFLTQRGLGILFLCPQSSPLAFLSVLLFLFPSENLCRNVSVHSLLVSFLSSFFVLFSHSSSHSFRTPPESNRVL